MLDFGVGRDARAVLASQQRVAIVTGSYDVTIDGVALTLNRLAHHLERAGHAVLVLCPGREGAPRTLVPAGTVVRVPSIAMPVWSEYRLTWGLGRHAEAALRNFSPTVLHIAVPDGMGGAVRHRGARVGRETIHCARERRTLGRPADGSCCEAPANLKRAAATPTTLFPASSIQAQRWAARRGVPALCSHHTRWASYLEFYAPPRWVPGAGLLWTKLGHPALERLAWLHLGAFHARCAATLPFRAGSSLEPNATTAEAHTTPITQRPTPALSIFSAHSTRDAPRHCRRAPGRFWSRRAPTAARASQLRAQPQRSTRAMPLPRPSPPRPSRSSAAADEMRSHGMGYRD